METEKPTNEEIGAIFDSVDDVAEVAEEEQIVAEDDQEVVEAEAAEESEEEPVEELAEEPGESFVEVEYDGVTYEVPENLKDALLRQSDYTQKTQTLADMRREVELTQEQVRIAQEEQSFVQEIQPELNNIGYLQAMIQQMDNDLQTNMSQMSTEDMFKKKIEADGLKEQLSALKQGLEVKYREFEEAQKQSYQELLERGTQILKQSIPNWSEAKQKEIRDYAISQGFSTQEVSSIVDPRHVKILWAASQFESLQDKAKPAAETIKAAPTIRTKSRNPMPKETQDRLNLRKKLKSDKLSPAEKRKAVAEDFGARWG
jgi:hypothetical protein